jgi:UDP-glucose 4-epimerase
VKKILVTGAAGFIGYQLAYELAKAGNNVTCVDNFSRGTREDIEKLTTLPNVNWVTMDLNNPAQYYQLDTKIEYIFHLAALNGTQNFYEFPFSVAEAASLPTLLLLRHYAKSSLLKRFVLASTSETYAGAVTNYNYAVPTDEEVPLVIEDITNFRWSYAAGKILSESAVIGCGKELGLPWTIIRYHNVYGPRMGDRHVIPDFLTRVKSQVYELFGANDTRSFIFIEDAVRATIDLAFNPAAQDEIVNVGSDQEILISDLANKILELMNLEVEITKYPSPEGSVPRRAPSLIKLKNLIGFSPRVKLEDGLLKTINWYCP